MWLAFAAQATIAAFGAFVLPAAQAAVPNLARGEEELRKAAALFGSLWGAMLAVGAALGGGFAALFGRRASFLADATSFLLAAVLVALIRRPMQEARSDPAESGRLRPIVDMKVGLHHARRDPVLLALMSSKATFAIGAGTVSLLAVLVTEVFHGGDGTTGLLLGMRGLGVALGPLIASRLIGPSLSRLLTTCGLAGLVFGTCYLGVSVAGSLALVALARVRGPSRRRRAVDDVDVRSPTPCARRGARPDPGRRLRLPHPHPDLHDDRSRRPRHPGSGRRRRSASSPGSASPPGPRTSSVTRPLRHRLRAEEDSTAAHRGGGQLARTALTASTRLRARTSPFSVESMRFMA